MNYFDFGPYDSDHVLVGTKQSNEKFENGWCVLIAGKNEESALSIAKRSIGERVGNPGFSFNDDDIADWLHSVNAYNRQNYKGFAEDIDKLKDLLGSISITGLSITHRSKTEIVAFYIETSEAEKRRILTSKRGTDDRFEALPPEFKFTPYWLAKLIIAQY